MTRTTIGQKSQRVLKFLLGARNPRVAAALAAHGFTEVELREGLAQLAAVARMRLEPQVPTEDPRLVATLEDFEKKWFGVAKLTLERHYPDVAEKFFANLSIVSGVEVAIAVSTFVERLSALEDPSGGYGPDAAAARALLASRGITADCLAQARTLVEQLGKFNGVHEAVLAQSQDQAAAEAAMWAWYIEWAGIARLAIHDRRLLRSLGFLRGRRDAVDDGTVGEDPPVATPSLPSGTSAPQLPAAAGVTHEVGAAAPERAA